MSKYEKLSRLIDILSYDVNIEKLPDEIKIKKLTEVSDAGREAVSMLITWAGKLTGELDELNRTYKKFWHEIYGDKFYQSRSWKELRYEVILKFGKRCMACGTEEKSITIDHIKPISKYPELALKFDNLQVLCWDCNRGKSNKDQTDFRPK